MSGEVLADPTVFIKGCNEFVVRKLVECEQLVAILMQHPECPQPQLDPLVTRTPSDEDIRKAIDVLNSLIDEEGEDAPLLPKGSPEKSSRHLRPGKSSRKSASPSPTRRKVQAYFAREFEKLHIRGTKWIRAHTSVSPPKKSVSPKSQSRTKTVITEILVQIEKIQRDLTYLDGFIRVCEESIICPDDNIKYPSMKLVDSVKNAIFLEFRSHVERQIKNNKEVKDFVELKSNKTVEHGSPGKAAEQPHLQSPMKKPKGQASPKAPKSSKQAGPSTVSTGGGSSGTPKRTRTKSESPQEKRKKASPETEDNIEFPDQAAGGKDIKTADQAAGGKDTKTADQAVGGKDTKTADQAVGGKDTKTADHSSSPEESDPDSRDTISSRFDESVQDLDLSETEDSKDKMEES